MVACLEIHLSVFMSAALKVGHVTAYWGAKLKEAKLTAYSNSQVPILQIIYNIDRFVSEVSQAHLE